MNYETVIGNIPQFRNINTRSVGYVLFLFYFIVYFWSDFPILKPVSYYECSDDNYRGFLVQPHDHQLVTQDPARRNQLVV
jgi:hypothetical protein